MSTDAPTKPPAFTDAVRGFMEAVSAQSDPEAMRDGLADTAEGSPARAYLTHLANVSEAGLDSGLPYDDAPHEQNADSYESCDDSSDRSTCVIFSNFKVDPSGKLVDLTVNGKKIGPRITLGNGDVVKSGGATFEFLSAYLSVQSNALFVTVKIRSGSKKISPNIYSATYRSPDGKQREATDAVGSIEVGPNSNTIVSMNFKGVRTGGKVALDGCVADCSSQFNAVMKVG